MIRVVFKKIAFIFCKKQFSRVDTNHNKKNILFVFLKTA